MTGSSKYCHRLRFPVRAKKASHKWCAVTKQKKMYIFMFFVTRMMCSSGSHMLPSARNGYVEIWHKTGSAFFIFLLMISAGLYQATKSQISKVFSSMLAIHPDKPGREDLKQNAHWCLLLSFSKCATLAFFFFFFFQLCGSWLPRVRWRIEIHLRVPDTCSCERFVFTRTIRKCTRRWSLKYSRSADRSQPKLEKLRLNLIQCCWVLDHSADIC